MGPFGLRNRDIIPENHIFNYGNEVRLLQAVLEYPEQIHLPLHDSVHAFQLQHGLHLARISKNRLPQQQRPVSNRCE